MANISYHVALPFTANEEVELIPGEPPGTRSHPQLYCAPARWLIRATLIT